MKLECAALLLALAKRHMSNICMGILHASMTFPIHIFVAWLNSNKKQLHFHKKYVISKKSDCKI